MHTRIRKLRKALGLSQVEFARKIGRHPGFVSSLESGKIHITDDTIRVICESLSVSEEWLRNGNGEMLSVAPDIGSIGERIRQVRNEEGLKQEDFGKRAGLSKNQIYKLENGIIRASEDILNRISGFYGISFDWLICGIGEMRQEALVDEALISWLEKNPNVIVELKNRMR